MNDLKLRYKMFESVGDWYASLSRADRQRIIREGLPPAAPDPDFWPDPVPVD